MQSAPGFRMFHGFCAEVIDDEPPLNCFTNVVSDDKSSDKESSASTQSPTVPDTREPIKPQLTTELAKTITNSENKNEKIEFSLDGPLNSAIVEDEEVSIADLQHKLMHWHYRLGHISFAKLKQLAMEKEIPYRLRRARPFRCTACMFAKATKTPWRKKAPVNKQSVPVVQQAGDCVSADQLESKTPGSVFVDHFSRLSFVYLQYSTSSEETLKAKLAFEAFAESHGVRVKHYHADNGRFADNLFRNDCAPKQQTQSFCGVNAHWQNGIAE
jgi:hypothetical protein